MLFSAAIASRAMPVTPVPAPRFSKTKQEQKPLVEQIEKEEIYEDLDELKFTESKLYDSKYAKSSKHNNNDPSNFTAPQVPPRNTFIIENTPKSSGSNSYENVYCEINPQQNVDKSRLVENLMDKNDNQNLMDKNDNSLLEEDEYADFPAQLGARPRKTR